MFRVVVVFLICLVAWLAVSHRTYAVEPGTYYCVTDYMAGIQYTEDDEKHEREPFVGKINPAAARERFTVRVTAYSTMQTLEEKLRSHLVARTAGLELGTCSYVATVKTLFVFTDTLIDPGLWSPVDDSCLDVGGLVFQGNLGEYFWITKEHTFLAGYSAIGNSYVMQGRCTAFE
jgi:hypothetical protein